MNKFKIKNKLTFGIFLIFILMGILDATNTGHSLISIGAPFLLALAAFVFGLYRFRVNKIDSWVLIVLNLLFLIFTLHTKVFILNIFILSLLVWSLIMPLLARFKAALPTAVIAAVIFSFVIPYYSLPIPLVPLLYFPIYIFGYMLENFNFKRNKLTIFYSAAGVLVSLALLYNTLARSLKIKGLYEKVYIQSLFKSTGAYVYSPVIAVGFLLLVFSLLVIAIRIFDPLKLRNANKTDWRSIFLSASILLPILDGVTVLHPGRNLKLCLIPLLAVLFVVLYIVSSRWILNRGSRSASAQFSQASSEASAVRENSIPGFDIDLNKVLFNILFGVCYVVAAIVSVQFIINGNDFGTTRLFAATPAFAYNLLFVGILYLLAVSVLGMRLGTIIAILVQALLLAANYLKLKYFSEPFFPWDFGLASDALKISKDYISAWTIPIAIVVALACIVLIARNIKKVLSFIRPRPELRLALIMAALLAFNLQSLGAGSFKSINVYKSWYDGINEFTRNGTYVANTLFLQHLQNYINAKPQGYSETTAKQLETKLGPGKATCDQKPDVIVILGETYWDPTNLSGVTFNKEIDSNLKKYQTATMVSPAFGGGTANVEFEVLTGFSNFFFNTSIISYNVYFKHNMPSVVGAFKDSGYDTVALHPNDGNFYNRNNAYKYMGFDEFHDIKYFDPSTQKKGNYVSDDTLVDKIAQTLKNKTGPAFVLGITMQNHDPYPTSIKNYGKNREITAESDKLNDSEKDVLSNFAQGVYDEDKALGKLIDVAKQNDRPTLIYFYGDHLPRLGVGLPDGNYEIYSKLGYTDKNIDPRSDMKFYETPLVIWSNYKDIPKIKTPISSNQVALRILQDAGIKYPSYFNVLQELGEKHPYLSSYIDNKEALANDPTIKDYYMVQYDIMFGKQYMAAK